MAKTKTTATVKGSAFDAAAGAVGVVSRSDARHPFLELKGKVGAWVTGIVGGEHPITFTPKKGKNKGKKQEATVYDIEVTKASADSGAVSGSTYALSVQGGLLGWLMTKGRPKGLSYPFPIAIRYDGQDGEERHKWEVRFPSAK
jgi:hypothetical protein